MLKKILAVFILALLTFTLAGCGETEIDLKQFANLEIHGVDGKATATFEPDSIKIVELIEGKRGTELTISELLELDELIKCEIMPSENLSNGDKVTAVVTVNRDLAKKYNVKFTNNKQTVTVSKLATVQIIDPFADLELRYEGVSPEASVKIVNQSWNTKAQHLSYSISKQSELKIGDKFTVTVNDDPVALESEGYAFSETSREYTVGNIDEYVSDFNQIPAENIAKMKREAEDLIESEFNSGIEGWKYAIYYKWGYSMSWTDRRPKDMKRGTPEIVHTYLVKLKPGEFDSRQHNIVVFVYKVHAQDAEKASNNDDYFVAIGFKNIIKRSNGGIDYLDYYHRNTYGNGFEIDDVYQHILQWVKSTMTIEEIPAEK